jgi:hypothetical protein
VSAAVRQYVTKSGETYDWLAKKEYVTQFLNFVGEQIHLLPSYETREGLMRKMLADSVEKNGGKVITETTVKYLLPNGDGPYYAITAEINNLGSVGGVLFNDTYVGDGVGIGYSFTSGRLGGEYAASNVLGK